ncbi:MAG TPA: MFS transporter [Roseiflexaceae bacterium]|nr:MFS transporter [Roseiflexaceae bacterium]
MKHIQQSPAAILALMSVAVFLGAVDLTIVTAVLPKIILDLGISIDTELHRAAWIISGYLLAYTLSIAIAGRISDLTGRRPAYLVCLVIFLIGSAAVAMAPTIDLVIAGRVVQALGAGALVPISMALVADLYPAGKRAAPLGIIAAVDTAGWMVGHLYGGALMRLFDDWRLLFWLNLPIGVLALALMWSTLRDLPILRAAGRFDWRGALLLSAGLTALNIGLAAGADLGQADFYGERAGPPLYALPLSLAAVGLLVGFVTWQHRSGDPLIEPALLTHRIPAAAAAINACSGFALALALANVPLFINTRLGLRNPTDPDILRQGAWESGLMLSVLTLSMALLAIAGGRLMARYGPRPIATPRPAFAAIGFAMLAGWQADTSYATMARGLFVAGFGLGLTLAPAAAVVIEAADPERRGAAAALVIVTRLIGMTVGVSVLTLFGVQRQDALRRAAAEDPAVVADPITFLIGVAAQVVGETFLFACGACVVGCLIALQLRRAG